MIVGGSSVRRCVSVIGTLALTVGVLAFAPSAAADTAPANPADPATPPSVSADALPTVQIDGVVWDQEVVGNTVYVVGKFNNARPAGAAPGTQLTARRNMLAYNLTTGALITSFNPNLNAQALAVEAAPDGSRVYVAGDFTVASGQTRNRVAAYDTATGALVSTFRPSVYSQVKAITATDSTVYVGGQFTSITGGLVRKNLAAFRASDGAALPWAPTTQEGTNSDGSLAKSSAVLGLTYVSSANRVIAVGRFARLNNVTSVGIGALEPTTGAVLPFAMSNSFTNRGDDSAIWSVSTDGTYVYGGSYDFYGPGNTEGVYAIRAIDGVLHWIADCRGDHYSAFRSGSVIYAASHAHDCSRMRAFPEVTPRVHHHATAFSFAPTTTSTCCAFAGRPAPTLVAWAPDFTIGSFTGQSQGPWHVGGNSQYVLYGGEFTRVNNTAQQGLVRFAIPSIAPNNRGPIASNGLIPTLSNPSSGTARVTWQTTWDQDNENLTYRVVRNGNTATPAFVTTVRSKFWTLSTQTFNDVGLPGGTYTYQIYAVDPFGNQVTAASRTVDVSGPAGNNLPPIADFSFSTDELTASFNGTASRDTDGTIESYAWTFGDGTTGSGPTPSRTYSQPGTYSVQLRVFDDDGASGTQTRSVTVGSSGTPLATDSFSRTVSGGWGTANLGGPWTVSPTSPCSVNGSAGVLSTAANQTVTASLNSLSSGDTAVQVQVAQDRPTVGSGNYIWVMARKIGTSNYQVRLKILNNGVVNVTLFRVINGTLTELQRLDVPGLTYTAGQLLNVRLDVSGSGTTTLRANVWPVGAAEPPWLLTATDSTAALQGPGAIGVASYASGNMTNGPVRISFDNLWAGVSGTAPPP